LPKGGAKPQKARRALSALADSAAEGVTKAAYRRFGFQLSLIFMYNYKIRIFENFRMLVGHGQR
jgi:hypothetical protein